ncbi:MAG: hypothetical protein WBR26_07630 [Candidatus Acidiferrum sp.]
MSNWKLALAVSLAFGCTAAISAQEKASSTPKVLQVTREYVKAGRVGLAHERTESNFVEAFRKANWPTNYIGMTSLSGKSRALFLTFYPTFEAWEKDNAAVAKNAELSSAIDKAEMADGDILDSLDQMVFYFSEDLSLHPKTDLSPMRFFEFTSFQIKPGKDREWREVVKMAKEGYEKGIPDAHWGMFSLVYGGTESGGEYVAITGRKTLAEVDTGFAEGKKFEEAIGEEGMKKLDAMFADCVAGTSQTLFAVNPHMSYVSETWIKSDPNFWNPKETAAVPSGGGADQQASK